MYSLLSRNKFEKLKRATMKKKFEFKKFHKFVDNTDYSDIDEEISEGSNSSFFSKRSNSSKSFKCNTDANMPACEYSSNSPVTQSSLFQNTIQNTANLNNNFTTARNSKTTSVLNKSDNSNSDLSSSSELNRSLDNLHLSNLKSQTCTSPVFSVCAVNRPVLSPPKLKNVTQNSWTAGGFWKNDVNVFPTNLEFSNLSRSSSQTSGFVSNNDPVNTNLFSSLPPSREPSVCGDFERTSILSEPPYHFNPINTNGKNSLVSQTPQTSNLSFSSNQLYYKADNNMFYPVLNQNNMLFIQGSNRSHNFESNFSTLSLGSINVNSYGIKTPPLFSKQPVVSSLFKNLQGSSPQPHNFKTPHC